MNSLSSRIRVLKATALVKAAVAVFNPFNGFNGLKPLHDRLEQMLLIEGQVELFNKGIKDAYISKTYFGYFILFDPNHKQKFRTFCAGPALLAMPLAATEIKNRPSNPDEIAKFKKDIAIAAKIDVDIRAFVAQNPELRE